MGTMGPGFWGADYGDFWKGFFSGDSGGGWWSSVPDTGNYGGSHFDRSGRSATPGQSTTNNNAQTFNATFVLPAGTTRDQAREMWMHFQELAQMQAIGR